MLIYTLEKVARIEGVKPNTLKLILYREQSDYVVWGFWKFQKFGNRWIATGIDDDLEICV